MAAMLKIEKLCKEFTLHQQGGVRIPVLDNVSLEVNKGEAVAVTGPSGRGKSSLLKLIYGSYKATSGAIRVFHDGAWVDAVQTEPREMIVMRRQTIGYVTQFLRVIPRVPALDIVAEPLIERGIAPSDAEERAKDLLISIEYPGKALAAVAHDVFRW